MPPSAFRSRPHFAPHFAQSSTGYSLTGCSPAEPLSASPIFYSFSLYPAAVYSSAANANLSLLPLSHRKGAPHSVHISLHFASKWLTVLPKAYEYG